MRKAGVTIDEQYSEGSQLEMVDGVGVGGGGSWEGHTISIANPVTFKSSLVG